MKFELKPYNLNVTDKELIEDLIHVAKQLGVKALTNKEYTKSKFNRFHGGTIANRLGGWNEALRKAELEVIREQNITDEDLIRDLKRVANEIAPLKLTQKRYNEKGKYTSQTINARLGWNKTLEKLNIEISLKFNISEKELFENIENVWIKLGHAPGRREMIRLNSKYSEGPYINKFGSWRKALEAFVEYINSDFNENQEVERNEIENNESEIEQENDKGYRHKTKRDISNRLKVQVLIRDGNKCRLCGVTVTGENIHFDHIKPWSKKGETELDNIQVLCAEHNLAKGNYYNEGEGCC
jgi:5-methylcytosine-specific restriction endonuclease McrA